MSEFDEELDNTSDTTPEVDELRSLIDELEGVPRSADGTIGEIDPLAVVLVRPFRITVGQLKRAVASNPTHPKANIFLKATRKMPDSHELFVEREDLTALLKGLETYTVERTEADPRTGDSVRVRRKLTRSPIRDSSPKKSDPDPDEREVRRPRAPTA